jgi:glycine/D-amino acid oxidase-like deaminating enzyme
VGTTNDVVVVGGGIGGLATAFGLARKGLRVRVLERASEFGEVGAGMQIAPNCTRILDHYDLLGEAKKLGVDSPLAHGDPSLALGTSTMTLLELTSAYAGVAANKFPVEPRAFPAEEEGWFDWLFAERHRLSATEHDEIEQLLARTVSQGTGRAA